MSISNVALENRINQFAKNLTIAVKFEEGASFDGKNIEESSDDETIMYKPERGYSTTIQYKCLVGEKKIKVSISPFAIGIEGELEKTYIKKPRFSIFKKESGPRYETISSHQDLKVGFESTEIVLDIPNEADAIEIEEMVSTCVKDTLLKKTNQLFSEEIDAFTPSCTWSSGVWNPSGNVFGIENNTCLYQKPNSKHGMSGVIITVISNT